MPTILPFETIGLDDLPQGRGQERFARREWRSTSRCSGGLGQKREERQPLVSQRGSI